MAVIPKVSSVSWLAVEIETASGFKLQGFLLYTIPDKNFPEYINEGGLSDLEVWSDDKCVIYVVHSPSDQWIEYAQLKNHAWWKAVTKNMPLSQEGLEILQQYGSIPIVQVGDSKRTLRDVLSPPINEFLHGDEIGKILKYFQLGPTQHPCMVLFKTMRDSSVWYVDMSDMLGISIEELRSALKTWFAGKNFREMLEEAGNA